MESTVRSLFAAIKGPMSSSRTNSRVRPAPSSPR